MALIKTKKISRIIVIILLIGIIFFCACPITFNVVNTKEDHSHILKDVYEQNNKFGDVPVSEIAMLGSHDALSNDINLLSKSDITRQKERNDNFASNIFFRIFAKGTIVRLSKAQTQNVYEQLKAGSRFLDFRVTDINEEFYNSHGLISNYYKNNLELVLRFLEENPGEFIIINIHNYYSDTKSFDEMCDYMKSITYNDLNIFDYINYDINENNISNITYNDVTCNGLKAGVIFVSKEYDGTRYKSYFKFSNLFNTGNSEPDYRKIDEKINVKVEESKQYDNSYIKVNQSQVTPQETKILRTFLDWSLINSSDKHNEIVIQNGYFEEWIKYLPIYLTDNVTSEKSDFNSKANEIIQKYNLSLAK